MPEIDHFPESGSDKGDARKQIAPLPLALLSSGIVLAFAAALFWIAAGYGEMIP